VAEQGGLRYCQSSEKDVLKRKKKIAAIKITTNLDRKTENFNNQP